MDDNWPPFIPGGSRFNAHHGDRTGVSGILSLFAGLNKDDLIELLRVENGSLKTTAGDGFEKNVRLYPVTESDYQSSPSLYNGGSIGLPKRIVSFNKTDTVGSVARETTFRYSIAAFPKFVTHIIDRDIELTQEIYDEFV